MAHPLIDRYHNDLARALQHGKSTNEQSVRNYFWQLLNEYARKQNYEVVPEVSIMGTHGVKVRPDGSLQNSWGLPLGYWESKDTKDDLEEEVDKKLKKGYPLTNALFEDTQTAVLYQYGQEVMRANMREGDELHKLLQQWLSFKNATVVEFEKALDNFKADIPKLLERLTAELETASGKNKAFIEARDTFLELCRHEINPEVSEADVREMLIQHLLTAELFQKIFDEPDFHRENNIARELEKLLGTVFNTERRKNLLASIEHYYEAINATAAGITDHHEKQKFLKVLYENFYKAYNPKAADRLGVVYTPNEIVRFMVRSTDHLLHQHFNVSLSDKNVEILDPATGTGTFVCEIIDQMRPDKLAHKYAEELHANEVAILPYYVANLNIEFTFKQKMGHYKQFPNLCFVDTLDNTAGLGAGVQHDIFGISSENATRIRRQNERRISVVIGNPPYNANQKNENENNKNREYPTIDKRIKNTYIKHSTAQKTKAYDMYTRFYRWAMDRVDKNGVIAFITNRSFIDSRTLDGFRKCVQDEFAYAYIIDTHSDVRANPKIAGTSHNVFGIQTGVAVLFLVRKEQNSGPCQIFYTELSDEMRKEEKWEWFRVNEDFGKLAFLQITPNKVGNWISDTGFESLLPLAAKEVKSGKGGVALLKLFCWGNSSNRDEWVYDIDESTQLAKAKYLASTYNALLSAGDKSFPTSLKWSRDLKLKYNRALKPATGSPKVATANWRPYGRVAWYPERVFNDVLTENHIAIFGKGLDLPNSVMMICGHQQIPFTVHAVDRMVDAGYSSRATQMFPLHVYDEAGIRHDNLTDWGLAQFTEHYGPHLTSSPSPTLPGGEGAAHAPPPTGEDGRGQHGLHTADPMLYAHLREHAEEMRKTPTKAEAALWQALRGDALGAHFRRQHVLDKFITDFACLDKRLVVEVDGDIHDHQKEEDAARTDRLKELGFTMLRFRNEEVLGDRDGVVSKIKAQLSRMPSIKEGIPLPLGEGQGGASPSPPGRVGEGQSPPPAGEAGRGLKEAIFHYVYAVLHDPAYREKYKLNLKREFPRIPFYKDFWQWSQWGKELMDLHIGYETVEPYPLELVTSATKAEQKKQKKLIEDEAHEPQALYARQPKVKVKLKADKEAGIIELDELTLLKGIPREAWDYKLGNRSALEWVLDQYKEKTPKDPTIREKFNTYRFADHKEKVIDLLKRVCTVSVRTVAVVNAMSSTPR